MSKQGSQHEFPELGEDEEDLDLPVASDYDEEEDEWFEEHDDFDGEPKEYDEPDDWDYSYDPYERFYFEDEY